MMMTLVETLQQFPVKSIEIDGQQSYREAGTGEHYLVYYMALALVLLHGSINC
jgi:hypothetical protein